MAVSHRLRSSLLLLAVVCSVAFAGIAGVASAKTTAAAQADTNGELTVGEYFTSITRFGFDPRSANSTGQSWVIGPLYAPLLRFDSSTGKYTPYLAKSLKVVDPRTVTVVLRSGAVFDNGQPVTAEDAKATLLATQANLKAGVASSLNNDLLLISSVDVIDPQTFTIHYSADASGGVYELLSGISGSVVPATAGAGQATAPVGNGPFKLVSYTPGQQIVLEKSSTFFDKDKVRLKTLRFLNLQDGTPQLNALQAGDIAVTAGHLSGGLDPAGYQALQGNKKYGTFVGVSDASMLYLDMCKGPNYIFSDVRVRQAVMYGTNRDELNTATYQDLGIPAVQLWGEKSPNHNPKVTEKYKYNPNKAKALLKEAGIAPGTEVKLFQGANSPFWQPALLTLKDQWGKIGLNVTIVPSPSIGVDWVVPASRGNPAAAGTTLFYLSGQSQKLFTLFGTGSLRNPCGYVDQEINDANTKLRGLTPTDPAAIAEWKAISAHIADTNPTMPLVYSPFISGWNAQVVGGLTPATYGNGTVAPRWDLMYIKK